MVQAGIADPQFAQLSSEVFRLEGSASDKLSNRSINQFVIQVRHRQQSQQTQQGVGVSGVYCKNGICVRNSPSQDRYGQTRRWRNQNPDGARVNVDVIAQNNRQNQTVMQQIRTIEGSSAYLAFGNSVPITTVTRGPFFQQA